MEFNTTDYVDFNVGYSIQTGELASEYKLNLSPLRLKKELNNVYNIQQVLLDKLPLIWRNIETYLPGEIVHNTADSKHYRSLTVNNNKQPDLNIADWEEITASDIGNPMDLSNYLAKDNTTVYTPTDDYNPATKKYVDSLIPANNSPDGYATNAAGDYPTDYKGTAQVLAGNSFYITDITNGSLVGTQTVNNGDLLIALVDNPGNDDTKWIIVESNRDQATETIKGVAQIATQTEVDAGTDDSKIVTPNKLASYSPSTINGGSF